MRVLPIAVANCLNESELIYNCFTSAIITHGHPRAVLGAILFGIAIGCLLRGETDRRLLVEYLQERLGNIWSILSEHPQISRWVEMYGDLAQSKAIDFKRGFANTIEETRSYLQASVKRHTIADYYRSVGALRAASRGSGIGTVAVAILLSVRDWDHPAEAVYTAANFNGSDTDTIASFTGALVGAQYGIEVVPGRLIERVQDRDYLISVADRLDRIVRGRAPTNVRPDRHQSRRTAYARLLAWEIGLHEMFWDALERDETVVHPTLGTGRITARDVRKVKKPGYVAKLFRVAFSSGQTCVFHSRVNERSLVEGSLTAELRRALANG